MSSSERTGVRAAAFGSLDLGYRPDWPRVGHIGVLCFSIAVDGIGLPATAAHVHAGAAGVAGDIVVPLEAPVAFGSGAAGASSGCLTKVSSSLLKDIATNPSQYYVNVHNAEFPSGAVRGQLAAA